MKSESCAGSGDDRRAPRSTSNSPIAKARIQRGLTQGQLAEMVGVKLPQISLWETGRRKPKLDALRRLGEALEVDWTTLT